MRSTLFCVLACHIVLTSSHSHIGQPALQQHKTAYIMWAVFFTTNTANGLFVL